MDMHPGQLTVTADVVRALVDHQFPRWRGLTVRPVASQGTVNALFRIGDRVVARFPLVRRDPAVARQAVAAEAQAARELFGRTRFPTPEPLGLGEPTASYPLPWSVQTWLPGTVATDPNASEDFARDLAEFVRDVRAIGTRGRTFDGVGRGGDLRTHDTWMATCLHNSEGLLPVARLRRMWAALRDLPRGPTPDVMNHGDLIPMSSLGRRTLQRIVDDSHASVVGPADP